MTVKDRRGCCVNDWNTKFVFCTCNDVSHKYEVIQ